MQNRYIGDVGDFGKYGLLRFLSGMTDDKDARLRMGLVWYLHPNEGHGADGKFVSFLMPTEKDDKSDYRNCDCELWGKLRDMVLRNARCVYCAQGAGILPDDTAFYDAPLHFPPQMPKPTRQEIRKFWLSGALQKTDGADMVYLDPDNGIADAKKMYLKDGPKFTYTDDIRRFWERGQSLVIYHHLGHGTKAIDQIQNVATSIRDTLGVVPIPLRFHRGTARVFFVIPAPCHGGVIESRVERFLGGEWGTRGHFSRV